MSRKAGASINVMEPVYSSSSFFAMNATIRITLSDCWAKTDEAGVPALSVRDHCVNVGSVGKSIVETLPPGLVTLLPQGAILLVAGHDIGKISPGFLLKCANWREQWSQALRLDAATTYEGKHAVASQQIFAQQYEKPSKWLMALGGHHGKYFCSNARPSNRLIDARSQFASLQLELLHELTEIFGNLPPEDDIQKGARLHWFTGFMIFSDWIGSNTTWFPLTANPSTLNDSSNRAESALKDIGWDSCAVQSEVSFSTLFDLPTPRPLQAALINAVTGPGLYIVEAPMGEGKTEAALAAAYRRWNDGEERGLYFALPTQLTSNRIHDRVSRFLEKCIADPSSIALIHGNAWLTNQRTQPLRPTVVGATQQDELDHASTANRWFSDSRRSLLAPFGVGTIDQALMAVLRVRFSALRMFALSGKVVVIDEVHSYDPYTSALVDRAVFWLLELRCTVIILSATLTKSRRSSLIAAAGAEDLNPSSEYPLITKVATGDQVSQSITIEELTPAHKTVEIFMCACNQPDWINEAVAAAESGACVLVIRNTIDLARESFHQFKTAIRDVGIRCGLIHSRFTQLNREANETEWMDLLGKNQALRPHGAILVGTQVLEQSIDIDADLLITDLAPTDLILQRIGRLHRHTVSTRQRPVACEKPRCLILQPEVTWDADHKNLKDQLKPHRFVYPPFSLYMADRVWSQRSRIQLPGDIRDLLEASFECRADLPDGVQVFWQELEKLTEEMENTAWANGVFKEAALEDVEGSQTRWKIQPTAHLVVLKNAPAQRVGGVECEFTTGEICSFVSGIFSFELARLLQLHAIRVPRYFVKNLIKLQPAWLQQHLQGAVLCVVDEFHHLVPCFGSENAAFSFEYNSTTGLKHTRNEQLLIDYTEDDESWF